MEWEHWHGHCSSFLLLSNLLLKQSSVSTGPWANSQTPGPSLVFHSASCSGPCRGVSLVKTSQKSCLNGMNTAAMYSRPHVWPSRVGDRSTDRTTYRTEASLTPNLRWPRSEIPPSRLFFNSRVVQVVQANNTNAELMAKGQHTGIIITASAVLTSSFSTVCQSQTCSKTSLVSWCFKPRQPQMIISELRETFTKRRIVAGPARQNKTRRTEWESREMSGGSVERNTVERAIQTEIDTKTE